jgi:hypothetical protein
MIDRCLPAGQRFGELTCPEDTEGLVAYLAESGGQWVYEKEAAVPPGQTCVSAPECPGRPCGRADGFGPARIVTE